MEGDFADIARAINKNGISIHTLRMEGDDIAICNSTINKISIHTLRMEGDPLRHLTKKGKYIFQSTPSAWRVTWTHGNVSWQFRFQSTPSAWRVTKWATRWTQFLPISIHTLRMEGDSKSAQKSRTLLFKVTDLRRNCRPDVHERTEGSLWQAVFAG